MVSKAEKRMGIKSSLRKRKRAAGKEKEKPANTKPKTRKAKAKKLARQLMDSATAETLAGVSEAAVAITTTPTEEEEEDKGQLQKEGIAEKHDSTSSANE